MLLTKINALRMRPMSAHPINRSATLLPSSVCLQPRRQQAFLFMLLLSLLGTGSLRAQTTNVTFQVTNAARQPLPFATVTVIPVPDTVHQQQQLSDSSGSAVFRLLQERPYRVRITLVNYTPVEKSITVRGDNPLFTFVAEQQTTTLSNVVVTATRPLIRQEDDKTIVDPEQLAASSTNAYEIMEKTPGLFVDQDGNIYLTSTTPATIYINGREQKMSTADVATMLKSLPPNAIASIEILRTPSARYDASGSGGIVNVVLRKGVRIGLTGSITVGGNQGSYGNQMAGINLNNNNGRTTTYLNLQYSRRNTSEKLVTDRVFGTDSLLGQNAFTIYPAQSWYMGYGLAYGINKRWDLSYDGRISLNGSRNRSTNLSHISQISTGSTAAGNEALVQNRGTNFNLTQGLSTKYKLDSAGSELTADLSYTYAPAGTEQNLYTTVFAPAAFSYRNEAEIDNRLQFFSAQANLLQKLPAGVSLETGLKSTNVWFNNRTDYFNHRNGSRVPNAERTGAYRYREGINAAYLQASKNILGIVLKAGTRLEHTRMEGRQRLPKDTSFTLDRTDLFPYVYLSKNLMQIAGYDLRAYLVYRRTISRPAYEYLNPSVRVIDPYLIEMGNPSLRPQFTRNYEANISVDERPIFAIGINDTKDIFTNVIYPSDSTESLSFRTYDNLGSNKETYFRILGAIPPGKRYFFVVGAQYNHNFYQGVYDKSPLMYKRGSWSLFTYQTFRLTPTTQLSLNGFARFNGQLQFYELSTFGALNLSLNQQFLNKKLVVSLSATDLFFTNNNHFVLRQGTVNATGFRQGDTRRLGLNFRYNFGFRKKEENNLFNIESPERAN